MTMRAYAVQEEYEGTGNIFFAEHAIVARRHGADEYADGDITAVTCRRAPWADQFAGAAVPARVMVKNGWYFECSGCDRRIDEDSLDDRSLPVSGVIGRQRGHVFCCSRCARRFYSIERRRKAESDRAIEALKAIVRQRLPEAAFRDDDPSPFSGHHAYVDASRAGWQWRQVSVSFDFPGAKHGPAHFSVDQNAASERRPVGPRYRCATGDMDAFEQWAEEQKRMTRPVHPQLSRRPACEEA